MSKSDLQERVQKATGRAYGEGVSAENIHEALVKEIERWEKHPDLLEGWE